MMTRLMWIKRKPLAAVVICAILVAAASVVLWQGRQVAEAAVLNPHPDLVGWWRFDEGTGNLANDSSGYGNDGTVYGDPSWVDGKYGKALSFDGTDDYVKVPDATSLHLGAESFSLELWVKVADVSGLDERLIYTYDTASSKGFMLYHHAGVFKFETWNPSATVTSVSISQGVWYHLVFVRDILAANKFKIYVDAGTPQEAAGHSSDVTTGQSYFLGCDYLGTNNFKGLIDEVRIYNRALSAAEIETLFQKGPDFSSRLLAKVPKGTTEFVVTISWQGEGSINVTIESPSNIYTENMVNLYQKAVYSTSSGVSAMLNIKRLAISVTALSSDEDWYITLEFNGVEDYRITVEAQT